MKIKIYKLSMIILLFSLFAAGSCEKEDEDPQLPPVTQTGEDTFGCLVNGEVWLPKAYDLFPLKLVVLERVNEKRIWRIEARQGFASNFYFGIYENSLKEEKVIISVDELDATGLYFSSKDFEKPSFSWRQELPGELIITKLDTINMILSGTFWFDAVNDIDEKVEIRDGRFDLIIDQIQP
jgi:hypothetical protein